MERWVLIGGVIAIFLSLAAMGWYYHQDSNLRGLCTSAEQRCEDDRRLP